MPPLTDTSSYAYLMAAILFEVTGTLLLPLSDNFTKILPTISLTICYMAAFYCLTFAIKTIPIALVYATWSGLGIFLIALFSYVVYGQSLSWLAILGLFFIIMGVSLVTLFRS
ncbi:MAG: multidrug efflux SMR transporter [Alphaproteobacteria bacterium GM7ARS4]|nr:multidrug efflux SMR transporter [Alphaproteobacteria bacterium GM7ARS4]